MSAALLTAEQTEQAVSLLRSGAQVALPTETVYGLAADALNPAAVAGIFTAKERPYFDPLIVHLPDYDWLKELTTANQLESQLADVLIEKYWPGPLTIVLPKSAIVPDLVTSGMPSVALRMSRHPVFRQIISQFGKPLAAPSANRFGRISPTTAAAVIDELGGKIVAVVDGGPTECGVESTIVRPEPDGSMTVLRPGPVAVEELEQLATVQMAHGGSRPEAPGQLDSHYAPDSKLILVESQQAVNHADRNNALLAWDPAVAASAGAGFGRVEILAPDSDLLTGATRLFQLMRQLDSGDHQLIVATPAPENGIGRAINDRLRRAANVPS